MPAYTTFLTLLLAGVLWSCALGLQRPPPRYSQQFMPETTFTCRNKIVGSYYADPDTDCQLFHVCVSVAGSIQDYRFLCPNDTAFDQESQTCADWYDVDCEAATLYYASDNFDLYRLGSGLESLHYDSIRTDSEPRDHLQHSESSDPVRSSANNLNRAAAPTTTTNINNNNNNNRDILRGSSSSNFFNNRNNGKEDDYENEKVYREDVPQEPRRKVGLRKIARKQQYNSNSNNINNNNNNNNFSPSTTAAPIANNQNNNFNNGNYYNGNGNFNQRSTAFVSSTTARPVIPQENFNRNQNSQKYSSPTTTFKPTTNYQESYNSQQNKQNNYQSSSSTARPTEYNSFNSNKEFNGQQTFANNFNQSPSTTARTTEYNNFASNNNNRKSNDQQTFNNQFNQNVNAQPTTIQPSTNYQSSDFTNYQQRNYNNIQRTTNSVAFQSTTAASTFYDNYNNNGQVNNRASVSTTRQDLSPTTTKFFTNNYAGSSYIPTTYSPVSKKPVNNENNQAQVNNRGSEQYNGQYDNSRTTNNGQYYDNSAKQSSQGSSKVTQFYDTTKPNNNNGQYYEVTKAPKKATQFTNYDNTNNGKYFESSTRSYDNFERFDGRSSPVSGFSPSSINKLAETPRPTTPVPRRTAAPNTYNPSTLSASTSRSSQSQPISRGSTFVSASPRPFSTTVASPEQPSSTARPKSGKKNDYDYAYYDNTGPLEYDGLDLEHVTGPKESAKITRN